MVDIDFSEVPGDRLLEISFNGIKVGDKVKTKIVKQEIVVGAIVERENMEFIVPDGADEFTYWIPVENVDKI